MVYNAIGQGFKSKPRGKPFVKGNKKGKIVETEIDTEVEEMPIIDQSPDEIMETLDEIVEENTKPKKLRALGEDEQIDEMNFFLGKNKLSIRYSKRHNRLFRVQVFLNNDLEIRPVTYNGSSTGNSFWKLLKGSMKK